MINDLKEQVLEKLGKALEIPLEIETIIKIGEVLAKLSENNEQPQIKEVKKV